MTMRRVLLAFAALMFGAALLGSACGGGGGDGGKAGTPAASPTYRPANTPLPTPLVAGSHVESPAVGYAADVPPDWTFRANYLSTPDSHVDAAFAPATGGRVQPNISITCATNTGDLTTDQLRDDDVRVVQALAVGEVKQSEMVVSGQPAKVVHFVRRINKEGEPYAALEQTDVLFATPRCGWKITLVVPEGELATYQPLFDAFLQSFKLL